MLPEGTFVSNCSVHSLTLHLVSRFNYCNGVKVQFLYETSYKQAKFVTFANTPC